MQLRQNVDHVERPQVQKGSVPWPNVVMLFALGYDRIGGWKNLQMQLFDQLVDNMEKMGE